MKIRKALPALAAAACCILCLAAAGLRRTGRISLPQPGQLAAVRVTDSGGKSAQYTDPLWISQLLAALSASVPTGKRSVQDPPPGAAALRVDLVFGQGGESTLFVYAKHGLLYVEQPYAGIWLAGWGIAGMLPLPG